MSLHVWFTLSQHARENGKKIDAARRMEVPVLCRNHSVHCSILKQSDIYRYLRQWPSTPSTKICISWHLLHKTLTPTDFKNHLVMSHYFDGSGIKEWYQAPGLGCHMRFKSWRTCFHAHVVIGEIHFFMGSQLSKLIVSTTCWWSAMSPKCLPMLASIHAWLL